jgi:sigma-B regulation protein RsbU (phosphoserine phosphatase)
VLRYTNAGHPDPLCVRRLAQDVVPLVPPDGPTSPPLGVREGASYSVGQTTLSVGDLVVLFTDGLFEVTDPSLEPYGEIRLRHALERRTHLPAGRLFDEILAEVQQFTGNRGFADDVCLLGVEVARLGTVG